MKKTLQLSRLQHLLQQRNGYLVLACGSLILNILFVIYAIAMIGKERIVLVPPSISKTFWVDGSHVSNEYLSEMALFFASLRLSATQESVGMKHDILLHYVDPTLYSALKGQLIEEVERIRVSHLTMAFHPVNVQVDSNKWVARVTGDLQTTIGQDVQPSQRVSYQMTFKYDGGRLLVKAFEEVKDNA
jgi:conjugal transfer pilus assembly protein TraE